MDQLGGLLHLGTRTLNSTLILLELLSACRYFRRHPNEKFAVRAMVAACLWGDFLSWISLDSLVSLAATQDSTPPVVKLLVCLMSAMITPHFVRVFLIERYIFMSRNRFVTLVLLAMALVSSGSLVVFAALFIQQGHQDFFAETLINPLLAVGISLDCDSLVAAAIFWELRKRGREIFKNAVHGTYQTAWWYGLVAFTGTGAGMVMLLLCSMGKVTPVAFVQVVAIGSRFYLLTLIAYLDAYAGEVGYTAIPTGALNAVRLSVVQAPTLAVANAAAPTLAQPEESKV